MKNIILALLKYCRSKSSFLTFCAGYRWHYVCNDVIIWFAYKWSKMFTKKLARGLKRFSIFQLTRFHQEISVFTKCPRDPQKWTIAPALKVAPCAILSHPFSFKVMLSQDSIHGVLQLGGIPKIIKLSVYCLIKNKSIKHRFGCFWKCVIFCLCCAHSAVKSRISLIFENLIPNNPSYIPCLVSTWIVCYTGRFDGVL